MNIDKIHTQNYYNLKRNIEENNFIEELNKTKAVKLLTPALRALANKLRTQINRNSQIKSGLPKVIENEAELNSQLDKILSKHELYKNIDEVEVTSKLFSHAIRKLDRRLFLKDGSNDEKHFLQAYVFYWLENNFAKIIAKDDHFKSYKSIKEIINQTEILHHFYSSFKDAIPSKWIKNDKKNWIEVSQDPKSILESIRTFDKDYFSGYAIKLNGWREFSPWKFVVESTRYSDYAMFTDEYSFKNSVLLKRDISLWIKFWDGLKWPLLQDIPFLYNEHPSDILQAAKQLVKDKNYTISNPKHLAFILLKNFFENALKVQENLSFYANTERISSLSVYEKNETILKKGLELSISWAKDKEGLYKEIIETLLKIISIDEMSEWVFSFTPRSTIRSRYDSDYNREITVLMTVFNPYVAKESFEDQIQNLEINFNLRKFEFLATQIIKGKKEIHAEKLINALITFIRSDKFYWDGSFSPAYWPALKSIGKLLSYGSDPVAKGKELIEKFKVTHEGWRISETNYKLTQSESFIYCGSILLLEHDSAFKNPKERNEYFEYILDHIVTQLRFMVSKIKSDYILPLYLLNLVANQMYLNFKEPFEKAIINDIDDLNTSVAILSNDDYKLLSNSSIQFKERINAEFNFHKRQFMQKGQTAELEKLESGIKKLEIDLSL